MKVNNKDEQTARVEASGATEGTTAPQPVSLDPFVRRMVRLGIPVTRGNYLRLVAPEADPADLDAELEASLPPELQLQGDDDD